MNYVSYEQKMFKYNMYIDKKELLRYNTNVNVSQQKSKNESIEIRKKYF